jgi:hypothetical protein
VSETISVIGINEISSSAKSFPEEAILWLNTVKIAVVELPEFQTPLFCDHEHPELLQLTNGAIELLLTYN